MSAWLVFWTWMLHDPTVIMGPQVSEKVFESRQECVDFVNKIAEHEAADSRTGNFEFASMDGMIFRGGCIVNEKEFDSLTIRMNFI